MTDPPDRNDWTKDADGGDLIGVILGCVATELIEADDDRVRSVSNSRWV